MNKEKKYGKSKHCLPSITRDVEYNPFIFREMFVLHPKMYTLCKNKYKLVKQSQIVQIVMQDCQYVLSHLLPECNLLVQGPKITYNNLLFVKTVLQFTEVFYIEFCSF